MRGLKLVALFLAAALPAMGADADVRGRIERRIEKAKLDQQGPITVTVEDGRAVLTGAVASVWARQQAEKAALKETRLVDNRLRVLPEVGLSDTVLRTSVADAILDDPFLTVFDGVGAEVEDGVVTLIGSVGSPDRRRDLEQRVSRIAGIREVRNRIHAQATSTFDDRLRRQLYVAIYGNDSFSRYAGWANPPIRILVNRGRVTLVGYVASPVERALLGHIARGVASFGVQNQVKLESEDREEPARRSSLD
jgi:osmotically-inducible protein OsmY